MKKLIVLLCICFLCNLAFAETIKLKSGESYEGAVIDRNDKYVTLQTGGAPVYLPIDQIDQIAAQSAEEAPPSAAQIPTVDVTQPTNSPTINVNRENQNVPPEINDVEILIKKVIETYRSLSSYQDEGKVVVYETPGSTKEITFKTYFKRPGFFRFEWVGSLFPRNDKPFHIIWADGLKISEFWNKPYHSVKHKNLSEAISAATGVSGGSSSSIPGLIIENHKHPLFGRYKNFVLLGEENLEGLECYHVQADSKRLRETHEFWIAKNNFMVLKIRTPSIMALYEEEIHRNIEINNDIANDIFTFSE